MKMYGIVLGAVALVASGNAWAEGRAVPPVNFLTWPAAKYQHYYETSNYIAESWRELGIPVNLNPQPFPSPMLGMWFTEHNFDVVMSVLSGSPARLDPEFYAANQFWTNSSSPGGMNVGSFSSPEIDKLIAEQTGLPVHVADDPLSAVAEGTGVVLHELNFLRKVARSDRTY